jgi:hypothetical protein
VCPTEDRQWLWSPHQKPGHAGVHSEDGETHTAIGSTPVSTLAEQTHNQQSWRAKLAIMRVSLMGISVSPRFLVTHSMA